MLATIMFVVGVFVVGVFVGAYIATGIREGYADDIANCNRTIAYQRRALEAWKAECDKLRRETGWH